jgi:hypothetical protein
MWKELYNRDPAVVGKPIRFVEVATTIAGVAPDDFDTPHGADFWFASARPTRHQPQSRRIHAPQAGTTIARAKPDGWESWRDCRDSLRPRI